MKPAVVRFYFDADVLGLARVICAIRPDCTFPGDPGAVIHRRERPPCPIASTHTPDHEWIAETARREWVVVTRDRKIQSRPAEVGAVMEHGARMVALNPIEAAGTWSQLEILMTQWRRIEQVYDEPAPVIYTASRTGLRRIETD